MKEIKSCLICGAEIKRKQFVPSYAWKQTKYCRDNDDCRLLRAYANGVVTISERLGVKAADVLTTAAKYKKTNVLHPL